MGRMFFNILATFAEFEADLNRLRTREGMAIARAKGKLRDKRPKLSDKQQKELSRMHGSAEGLRSVECVQNTLTATKMRLFAWTFGDKYDEHLEDARRVTRSAART